MQAKTFRRVVIAVAVSVIAATAAVGAVKHSPFAAPAVGVATGEYVGGVPVYRLPTVNVTVSRSAALAEMAREDALARAADR